MAATHTNDDEPSTPFQEVKAEMNEAHDHLVRAERLSNSVAGRDPEEWEGEFAKGLWTTPVILRRLIKHAMLAAGADTKADCADHVRKAHETAFGDLEGTEAAKDALSDDRIVSDDWHEAAERFADAIEILDEQYERVNDRDW